MWWFEAAVSGFSSPTHVWRVQLFQILFSVACLCKTMTAIVYGWKRWAGSNYERFELRASGGALRLRFVTWLYRPSLLIRGAASLALLFGVLPRTACITIAVTLVFELLYEKRFNTIYLLILAICLACAGSYSVGFRLSSDFDGSNTWAQFLIFINAWHIYWNSAWQKVRSRQFMSGLLLSQYVRFVSKVESDQMRGEFAIVEAMHSGLLSAVSNRQSVWKACAIFTVLLEIGIPLGLMFEETAAVAAVAGILMHLGFTLLMPRQIVGFSIASVGTFVVFAS